MFRSFRLILTCSFLLISTPLVAQESEGWQVTERCLGELPYPTIPQSQWNFEGVIFSRNYEGVRAIRADVETSYFVALEADDSFPSVGGFSPDGRWFAYPVGATDFGVNSAGDNILSIDALVVVSTSPDQELLRQIPWDFHTFSGFQGTRSLPQVYWVDDQRFTYAGEMTEKIINPFTDEFEEWSGDAWLGNLRYFSPDFSRATYFSWHNSEEPIYLYDVSSDEYVSELSWYAALWFPDSSEFLMTNWDDSENTRFIALYSKDGEYLERIVPVSETPTWALGRIETPAWAMAPDGSKFAYIDQDHLYIASMEDKQIYDTCLTITPTNFYISTMSLAWSPDSQSIVFLYDGYPIILNTETLEMQILRYETGEIIGWYPLP